MMRMPLFPTCLGVEPITPPNDVNKKQQKKSQMCRRLLLIVYTILSIRLIRVTCGKSETNENSKENCLWPYEHN